MPAKVHKHPTKITVGVSAESKAKLYVLATRLNCSASQVVDRLIELTPLEDWEEVKKGLDAVLQSGNTVEAFIKAYKEGYYAENRL